MGTASRPAISAFIITYNEREKIEECLRSLAWLDEIVVVDDMSSDGTVDVCERYGAKVFQRRFTGFKDQKSHAMSLTSHDWVLEIDADERVSEEMRRSVLALGEDDFAACACFEFPRLTRFWGKWIRHSSFYPDFKGRLYDKRQGAWSEGNVHERFIPRGVTRRLAGDIIHPQDLDLNAYLLRTARYAGMSAADSFQRGKRACWHHVTVRPLYTFIYRYLLRLGFLDGVQGFVIAVMGGIGTFMKYLRLYEMQKGFGGGDEGRRGN